MQAEVVKLALDLLVREPDIEGFFGGLDQDDGRGERELHVRRVADRRERPALRAVDGVRAGSAVHAGDEVIAACVRWRSGEAGFPCESMAAHLFGYAPGWSETIEYERDDPRLPEADSRVQPPGTDAGRSSPRRCCSATGRSAG